MTDESLENIFWARSLWWIKVREGLYDHAGGEARSGAVGYSLFLKRSVKDTFHIPVLG